MGLAQNCKRLQLLVKLIIKSGYYTLASGGANDHGVCASKKSEFYCSNTMVRIPVSRYDLLNSSAMCSSMAQLES